MPDHDPSILLSKTDYYACLTLNRPAKLNAFDGEMIQSLADRLEQVTQGIDSIRCVVVTGAGRGFCAGADLDFLLALRQGNRVQEFRSLLGLGRRVVTLLREIPVPVIAAIHGAAAGGGGSIAMACDLRIANESARFTQAFAKVGVHADFGASFFLPRLVGESKARELLLTGETIAAAEAHRIGLVSQVVPDGRMEEAIQAAVQTLSSRAPLSLKLMKQSLVQASQVEFQHALDRELEAQLHCFQSEDFLTGIESFLRKTPATFRGR